MGRVVVDRLLSRGFHVRSLGRSPQLGLEALGVDVLQGDIADKAAVQSACSGVDVVFHIAAKAGVWGPRSEYVRANIIGTQHVVEACKEHGVKKLIYTSTPSVVFNRKPLKHVNESMPYGSRWLCAYAQTKAIAEYSALSAHDANGLQVVALRPHLIWGPGDPHLLPRILLRARAGRLYIVGRGDNWVDITYVDNAADAHLCAMDALDRGTCGGKAYFISQGEPVQLWPWINHILERCGIPVINKKIPLWAAYAAGALLESTHRLLHLEQEPPMTRFVAIELAKTHTFDISAARKDLDYHPRISTELGLNTWLQNIQG